MKKIIKYLSVISAITAGMLLITTCTEPYLGLIPIKTDNIAPGKITVNEIIPRRGALELHFSLPEKAPDVVEVIASYVNKRGETVKSSVSRYSSSILVEGMAGTEKVSVGLKIVDNSGNESETVTVEEAPLLSTVEYARKTMEVDIAFGGVRIDWENETGDLIVIHVLTEDTLQILGDTVFTEDISKRIYSTDTIDKRTFAYVRQYPNKELKFGFALSDKWGNRTDTLIGYWTPLREDALSHTHIEFDASFGGWYTSGESLRYEEKGENANGTPKDGCYYAPSYGPHTLFDGSKGAAYWMRCYFTKDDDDEDIPYRPAYSSYDLQVDARLSRMQVFWRPNDGYVGDSAKRWRFWGTDDNNDEKYSKFPEGWTLIGEYIAPDSAIPGRPTDEEKNDINENGIEFDIEGDNVNPDAHPKQSFRYMRIELWDSYNKHSDIFTWSEIYLWGLIDKRYYTE